MRVKGSTTCHVKPITDRLANQTSRPSSTQPRLSRHNSTCSPPRGLGGGKESVNLGQMLCGDGFVDGCESPVQLLFVAGAHDERSHSGPAQRPRRHVLNQIHTRPLSQSFQRLQPIEKRPFHPGGRIGPLDGT